MIEPIKFHVFLFGRSNDLMKRLIYLIDTLIDSLQRLFNTGIQTLANINDDFARRFKECITYLNGPPIE